MGFLDTPLRIDVGDGEWIDVHRISATQFRAMQKDAASAEPEFDGDDKDTAESFHILRGIRQLIIAWSDPSPVTPENIERLPLDINAALVRGVSAGATSDVPLPIISTSSVFSEAEME